MGAPRPGRLAYTARPTALTTAVATLLGALFLCLGPAADPHHASAAAPARTSVGIFAGNSAGAFGFAAEGAQRPLNPTRSAYTCPYDEGRCALTPVASAAVLTGPPTDAPVDADASSVRAAPPAKDHGRPPRGEARPRAPDLHVLQVLRT
ncbi:hypothetical protein QCN29_07665 [Streptomyces sp. HNM0663]|uniref:Uncharacterized protein n=1 Tax=Streptomyces chengmaiensis TaxID=3040919 RepID=A0ABT6HIU0_9ACTN|nr:hypothetical protein [Streptomyces chengmaiensis]MDH2388664.1 hypothetical protein [Streptomyces chengmaiensis]